MVRILLIDPHTLICQGVHALLSREPDLRIIGHVPSGREALRLVDEDEPDLVITEIALPELNGIDVTRQICAKHPLMKVIALTQRTDDEAIHSMLQAGACAYILKDYPVEELLHAIKVVMSGQHYLCERVSAILARLYVTCTREGNPQRPTATLSSREREVWQLIVEGASSAEIAGQLCLSVRTVETHRQRLLEKTGSRGIPDLVKLAVRERLIDIEIPGRVW